MLINTKPFGSIEVDERQKVYFPYGILGFEEQRDYVLIDSAQPPFYWLQSVSSENVAFVLMDPLFFRPDYRLKVPREDLEELGLESESDALVFAIVTIPEKQELMTANLQGPVIINKRNKLGRQSISTDARWKVRHVVLEELAAVRDRAC